MYFILYKNCRAEIIHFFWINLVINKSSLGSKSESIGLRCFPCMQQCPSSIQYIYGHPPTPSLLSARISPRIRPLNTVSRFPQNKANKWNKRNISGFIVESNGIIFTQVCDHELQCQCQEGWAPPDCDDSSMVFSRWQFMGNLRKLLFSSKHIFLLHFDNFNSYFSFIGFLFYLCNYFLISVHYFNFVDFFLAFWLL